VVTAGLQELGEVLRLLLGRDDVGPESLVNQHDAHRVLDQAGRLTSMALSHGDLPQLLPYEATGVYDTPS